MPLKRCSHTGQKGQCEIICSLNSHTCTSRISSLLRRHLLLAHVHCCVSSGGTQYYCRRRRHCASSTWRPLQVSLRRRCLKTQNNRHTLTSVISNMILFLYVFQGATLLQWTSLMRCRKVPLAMFGRLWTLWKGIRLLKGMPLKTTAKKKEILFLGEPAPVYFFNLSQEIAEMLCLMIKWFVPELTWLFAFGPHTNWALVLVYNTYWCPSLLLWQLK